MARKTKTDYFKGCETNDECKKRYRELCKQLHPDNGGNEAEFKEMQAQFTTAFEQVKHFTRNMNGEKYEKHTEEMPEEFMNAMNAIIHLVGLEIEVCGRWIWVGGNTREYTTQLKEAGFFYRPDKQMWSWNSKNDRTRRKGRRFSMTEIREMHGSERWKTEEQAAIAG